MILKYIRLPFCFDAERLKKDVSLLEYSGWQPHYQRLHYQGEWTVLPLRSSGGKLNEIIIPAVVAHNYADTLFLKKSSYLQEVLNHFKCPINAVRLMKLN